MIGLGALAVLQQSDKQNVVAEYATIALVVIIAVATLTCIAIGSVYLWRHIKSLFRDYQKEPGLRVRDNTIVVSLLPPHGIMLGNRFEFTTQNNHDVKFEYNQPIQAARFIKPVEKIIRPSDAPTSVHCEPNPLLRFRNKIFLIPTPRIVVKQFVDNGIIFDEENTYGVKYIVELTPTSPQVK